MVLADRGHFRIRYNVKADAKLLGQLAVDGVTRFFRIPGIASDLNAVHLQLGNGLAQAIKRSDQALAHGDFSHRRSEHIEHLVHIILGPGMTLGFLKLRRHVVKAENVDKVFFLKFPHGPSDRFPIHIHTELIKHHLEYNDRALHCQTIIVRLEMPKILRPVTNCPRNI